MQNAKKGREILLFQTKINDIWGGSEVKSEYTIHIGFLIISIQLMVESKMKCM